MKYLSLFWGSKNLHSVGCASLYSKRVVLLRGWPLLTQSLTSISMCPIILHRQVNAHMYIPIYFKYWPIEVQSFNIFVKTLECKQITRGCQVYCNGPQSFLKYVNFSNLICQFFYNLNSNFPTKLKWLFLKCYLAIKSWFNELQ